MKHLFKIDLHDYKLQVKRAFGLSFQLNFLVVVVVKENGYDIEEDGLFNGVAGDIASNISDAVADVVDTINDSVDDGDDCRTCRCPYFLCGTVLR